MPPRVGRDAPWSLPSGERGAAVADFVLVMVPLLVIVLGVLQVGFALHVRNTIAACAADGARAGANADRGPGEAQSVTSRCIASAVGSQRVQAVQAGFEQRGAVTFVAVRVQASLPVLGPLGPDRAISVEGHALWEGSL